MIFQVDILSDILVIFVVDILVDILLIFWLIDPDMH